MPPYSGIDLTRDRYGGWNIPDVKIATPRRSWNTIRRVQVAAVRQWNDVLKVEVTVSLRPLMESTVFWLPISHLFTVWILKKNEQTSWYPRLSSDLAFKSPKPIHANNMDWYFVESTFKGKADFRFTKIPNAGHDQISRSNNSLNVSRWNPVTRSEMLRSLIWAVFFLITQHLISVLFANIHASKCVNFIRCHNRFPALVVNLEYALYLYGVNSCVMPNTI